MQKIFTLVVLFFVLPVCAKMETIFLPDYINKDINTFAGYSISYDDFACKSLDKIHFVSYEDFVHIYPAVKDFPSNVKSIFIKFSIKNTSATVQKFYINSIGHYFYLYDINQSEIKLFATFGKFNQRRDFPLPNDPFNAPITLKPGETKFFLLQTKQNNYAIYIPRIRILDEISRLKENAELNYNIPVVYISMTYVVLGFLLFVMIFCGYQIFFSNNRVPFFFLMVLAAVYILYFGTNYEIFHVEVPFLPRFSAFETASYIGILFPPAHFLFILSLIRRNRKSAFIKGLYLSCFFYLLIFIEEYSDFQNPFLCDFFQFINVYGVFYSVIILTILFVYLLRYKDFFHRTINFGLLLNLLAALFFFFNYAVIKYGIDTTFFLRNFYNICLFHEVAVVLDFSIFIFAIIYLAKKEEKQQLLSKQLVEEQLEKTNQELTVLKGLVEKENIILKDKTKVNLNQLMVIKSDDHYLKLFTSDNKNHFVRGKLSDIITELPSNFIRCHRSYIINKNYIKKIQKFIVMQDNSEIPVSRGFKI